MKNMKKPILVLVISGLAILAWRLGSSQLGNHGGGGDQFIKKQAIQSALFPTLGPLMKENLLQPTEVILKPEALGVVFQSTGNLSDHSVREDLRARLMVQIREWAELQPELKDLHVFVQFGDELNK